MKINTPHSWKVTPAQAVQIQKKLQNSVILEDNFSKIKKIAGVDVSYRKGRSKASVVILKFPELNLIESLTLEGEIGFPYVPGLLSFREIPLLIPILEKIESDPDLIIADGQGIAHPRRTGLAAHLGLLTDIPSIGCAKTKLFGTYKIPPEKKGSYEYLYNKKDVIGAVVRTRSKVAPVFVSPGHKISLATSIDYVLKCCTKYRLPEPIRYAHRLTR